MRKIKAILLVMALVVTLGSIALAHDHDDDDNRNWGQNRNADAQEYGYHNGYRDGFQHGRVDRSRREGYDWRSDDWQRGRRGYESYMGPSGQYKKGYRDGYRTGYDDAYYGRRSQYGWTYGQNGRRTPWDPDGNGVPGTQYPNYPQGNYPQGNYPQGNYPGGYYNNGNAQRFGYQDGVEAGRRDRSSGHSYRPHEWEAWKDADHGMSSSTGYRSADDYKRQYRQAFENGYSQGYGSYRR